MKVFILLSPIILFGQYLSVNSELDTTRGFIGDVFNWTIKVEGLNQQTIKLPELTSQDDTISIKKKNYIYKEDKLYGIQYELIPWDTGRFKTPEFSIRLLNNGKFEGDSIIADPIYFSVSSILTSSTKTDFQDIKDPVPVKGIFPIRLLLYCFILIVIVLGIAWVWRKRQLPRYHKIDYSNIEAPYARASRRLRELDDSGLIKEYYSELSHISREYIETKYFIRTLEMTTEEIDEARKLFPVKSDHLSEWIEFLYAADQVKYARSIPKAEMMLFHKNKVKSMIEQL